MRPRPVYHHSIDRFTRSEAPKGSQRADAPAESIADIGRVDGIPATLAAPDLMDRMRADAVAQLELWARVSGLQKGDIVPMQRGPKATWHGGR